MNFEREFLDGKKIALEKLANAKKQNLVDEGILPILELINSTDEYFTTSSCFGRIVILEIPEVGDKRKAKFLGKWHRTVKLEEIRQVFKNAKEGQLWILAQSPIIHLLAKTTTDADKILKIAYSTGFKHSGYKTLENKFVIELCSTERLDAPIGRDGKVFCIDEHLSLLVDIANEIIEKSSKKLYNFERKIKKDLSTDKSTI